ncbi:hypothetical protein AK972_3109 [Pseudomonas yamanorum]|nr:hypothetical protein AK972_3109 [Pseudomonas yamanorum]
MTFIKQNLPKAQMQKWISETARAGHCVLQSFASRGFES